VTRENDGVEKGGAWGLVQVAFREAISVLMGMAHRPSCRRFLDTSLDLPYGRAETMVLWPWWAS